MVILIKLYLKKKHPIHLQVLASCRIVREFPQLAAASSVYCFVVQAVITDNKASCIHRCCIANNTEELMQLAWAAVELSPAESVTQQAFNAECQPPTS